MNEEYKTVNMFQKDTNYRVITQEEIRDFIDNINISKITLQSESFLKVEGRTVKFAYADFEHPLVLEKDFSDDYTLYIDFEWYLKNEVSANELISFISRKTKSKTYEISDKVLIDSKLIKDICSNPNIETVDFGRYTKDGYVLTEEHYEIFKKSKVSCVYSSQIDKSLEENFDSLIGYNNDRKLISYYSYKDLISPNRSLYISEPLNMQEIDNLKYLDNTVELVFENEAFVSLNDVFNKLKELGKSNKVILKSKDKTKLNELIFNTNINYDNLYVQSDLYQVPYNSYLRMEKVLYKMVEPAKNFSPFEKFIYVYNLTKRYKEYNENESDRTSSRNLYDLLENEYMVCVGFSNLLGDLCEKVGIETVDLSVTVDISYDNKDSANLSKSIPIEKGFHARRYIHLKDDKYEIDGYYISDPTWDNSIENDFYNYMLMTDNEVTHAYRYIVSYGENIEELFNVGSVGDFYNKFNFILNRLITTKNSQSIISDLTYKLVRRLEMFDEEFTNELRKKYPILDESLFTWEGDLTDLISDIAYHIVSKVNKEISGETIMRGVHNLYQMTNLFGEKTEEEFNKTLEKNKNRQKNIFPKRFKEYEDGRTEIYDNDTNKFDIEVDKINSL